MISSKKFIYFISWLCWIFVALCGLSLVAVSWNYSALCCSGFSLWWLLLLRRTGSRAWVQEMRRIGLVAPWHVESSRTRDRTHVPCTGRFLSTAPPEKPTDLFQFSVVQSLHHVRLFTTPWTAARQASLSITTSQSLLKLMSIELVMSSNHLILHRPLLLPPSIFLHQGLFQ